MAEMINLGSFGKPSSVNTTDLAQALAQGASIGESMRSNREKEKIEREQIQAQLLMNQRSVTGNLMSDAIRGRNSVDAAKVESARLSAKQDQDYASKRAELQIQLAKVNQDEDKVNREHATTLLADISTKYHEMSPEIQKMFTSNPQFKTATKLLKTYLPERFDDNGNLIPMESKEIAQTGIENIRRNITMKLKNEVPLTPGETRAKEYLDKTDSNDVKAIMDLAAIDDDYKNPKTRGMAINKAMDAYLGTKERVKNYNPATISGEHNDPLRLNSTSSLPGIDTNSMNRFSSGLTA